MTSVNLKSVYAFAREMYPKKNTKPIQYGTSGFRDKADILESVMFRMGVLATLRSRYMKGVAIGAMITASHNPEPDNGVKLIDPKGEMLEKNWESVATSLVNVPDEELEQELSKIIEKYDINLNAMSNVYVGMDNRYHSPQLLRAVSDGVLSLKGNIKDFGIVTTPMLHYFVVAANTKGAYGEPTEEGYYRKLIKAFENLRGTKYENGNYRNRLIFDGANGVGARKMLQFLKRMNNTLSVEVINKGEGKINEKCGADYVKLYQCLPKGFVADDNIENVNPNPYVNVRCCSVDGDADRVVYFFMDEKQKFHLLDGDRMATLIAEYLMDLLKQCNLELCLGLVQTAYANGASTDYITNQLKIPVACVETGVKHLHHKALEYDIGIYFEANGHGSIVFNDKTKETIQKMASLDDSGDSSSPIKILLNVIDLVNETVGDAISDMLLVETILHYKGWNVQDWLNCYDDLPNIQLKIQLEDRNVIETTDACRYCTKPIGLQEAITEAVNKYKRGRCFVRPSGTENVVRVYAEAANKKDTIDLAYEVASLVRKMAGGIGPELIKPEIID